MEHTAGGGAPESRAHGLAGPVRARNAWMLAAGVVVGILGLVSLAGSVNQAVAGAAIFGVVCSFLPSRAGHAAALCTIGLVAVGVVISPSSGAVVFAGLVLVCTVVARSAAALLPSVELLLRAVSSDRLERESVLLDERAHTELTRARRYERPLSVVAVRVEKGGKQGARDAVKAGLALTRELRVTDVVGVTDAGEVIAILPETGRDVVADLLGRLAASVLAAGANGSIGTATFPEDAVTWARLQETATERGTPIVAAAVTSNHGFVAQLKEPQTVG